MPQEKGFRKRKSVGMLLDDVSSHNDLFDIPIGDFALAHSLFGMCGDAIAILGNGLPESRDVKFGHPLPSGRGLALLLDQCLQRGDFSPQAVLPDGQAKQVSNM